MAHAGLFWPLAARSIARSMGFGKPSYNLNVSYRIITLCSLQILGFDSLEVLPLFAIIILSFRKESLMQVSSLDSIEAILADLSSIKVLPLVQLALSRD